jgi:RimJ/RimL family protein N-acetyltransferase
MPEVITPILREVPDELVGERVLLRPYRPGDGAQLWEAVEESRDHHLPWIPWGEGHKLLADSEESARKMQVRWLLREDLPLGIWERTTGTYLGGINLNRFNWAVPSLELGYWLRKSAEGHGYMTEAGTLVCSLAFETLGVHRVEIHVASGNHRSVAVPRRLGFIHEATLRQSGRIITGELVDMMVFSMLQEEYKASDNHRNGKH